MSAFSISSRSGGLVSVAAVLGAVTALFTMGCAPGDNPLVSHVVVDTGAMTPLPSGVNTGSLAIDYASGGHWRASTTCNATLWQGSATITPQPGTGFSAIAPFGFGPADAATLNDDGSITLDTSPTNGAVMGITFDGTPGAWIEVDAQAVSPDIAAYLWATSGGKPYSVPTNPADLYPSSP